MAGDCSKLGFVIIQRSVQSIGFGARPVQSGQLLRLAKYLALILIAGLLAMGSAQAQEKPAAGAGSAEVALKQKEYELIGLGTLRIAMPASWQDTFSRGVQLGVSVDELDLHEADTNVFRILVSVIHQPDQKPGSFEAMKTSMKKVAEIELASAGEKDLDMREFKEGNLEGCYFTLTDPQPKPGEYKYLTQGMAQTKGVVVTFRVVSNRQNGVERKQALEMIKSVKIQLPKTN